MKNNLDILSIVNNGGIDFDKLLLMLFESYEANKKNKSLYSLESFNPQSLIKIYYKTVDEPKLDGLMTNFKKKYIKNESNLELVHEQTEIDGLGEIYDYIHTFIETSKINIYTTLRLNQLLFSHTPYPEAGGKIRNHSVFLPGTGIDLVPYEYIPTAFIKLDSYIRPLVETGIALGKEKDINKILDYIEQCIKIKVELIHIHPFEDGNGRTSRAFLNLLFKLAGIPPVYVEPQERVAYQKAMHEAIDKDYTNILNFYFYKICDSIYELDIKERIKLEKEVEKPHNV